MCIVCDSPFADADFLHFSMARLGHSYQNQLSAFSKYRVYCAIKQTF